MAARKAKFGESQMVLGWLRDNAEKNWLDERVLDYDRAEVLVAPAESPTTCLPIYLAMMLDSLGHDKDADAKERLAASLECLQLALQKAAALGLNEVFYIASDKSVDKRMEAMGFEPVWCYRRRF